MKQRVTTLKAAEMLSLWKLLGGYEPLNDGCAIDCTDGLDLDAMLLRRIEGWYANQLLTAPADALPVYDIADDVCPERGPDGSVTVQLLEGTVRLISVKMAGWQRPAIILSDRQAPEALAQRNPFSRATASSPVAIHDSLCSLSLYPAPPGEPVIESLLAVIHPREGIFLMTDALKERIPRFEP